MIYIHLTVDMVQEKGQKRGRIPHIQINIQCSQSLSNHMKNDNNANINQCKMVPLYWEG